MELLVTVGIILTLTAVVVPIGKSCIDKARAAREVGGARAALMAWQSYGIENNGDIIPGYKQDPAAQNAKGQTLSFPTNARYVFRLAPYLGYELRGRLLCNKQAGLTSDYEISMAPSFGINLTFVGGDYGSGSDKVPNDTNFATYGKFVVTKMSEIHSPSKLLVFASARITDATLGSQEGYNAIKSPYFDSRRWIGTYDEKGPYYNFGAVHPRFDDRAVCAMADGHIEFLTIDQLMDMRRWSNQAAQADDPNWTMRPL